MKGVRREGRNIGKQEFLSLLQRRQIITIISVVAVVVFVVIVIVIFVIIINAWQNHS